ncbi:hypothetical protein [Nostoc sp. UHCC 0252]|nr:hypothetical protein [Nostoc sp. UHCC 0252]MEA5605532.1 hypothetical protein [Nostoc sp. UHCC 0252]
MSSDGVPAMSQWRSQSPKFGKALEITLFSHSRKTIIEARF